MSQVDSTPSGAFRRDEEAKEDWGDAPEGLRSARDQNLYLKVPLPPPKVLLLDDDINVRTSLREDFKERGIEADCVATTAEAKGLLTPGHIYKVIFVDIKLSSGDITGDEFILRNRKLMGGAKVAAITAEFYFKDMPAETLAKLIQVEVEIIPKRKNFSAKLIETVETIITEEKQQMLPKVENFLRGEVAPAPVQAQGQSQFVMMLEQILLDWLKSREHPDKKRILHGGSLYSYNDIAAEIEEGTELGQAHLKMMANLFMRTLNIDS